jgi:hypothetical protein
MFQSAPDAASVRGKSLDAAPISRLPGLVRQRS